MMVTYSPANPKVPASSTPKPRGTKKAAGYWNIGISGNNEIERIVYLFKIVLVPQPVLVWVNELCHRLLCLLKIPKFNKQVKFYKIN